MRSNSNYRQMPNNGGCATCRTNAAGSRNCGMNCQNGRNQCGCSPSCTDCTGCQKRAEQSGDTCGCQNRCGEEGGSLFYRQDVTLGMAYVPIQRWENLFATEQGICNGTIFKDLIFPFQTTNCPVGPAGRRGM